MEPTTYVPPSSIHRVLSADDTYHNVRSNSIVLSGQDDGSPLCTSHSLLIGDGSRPTTDASFGSSGVNSPVAADRGGWTTKSATSPASNSRVDLFGDQTPMGLPSPMMKFRCASGPADYPLTRACEERLLLARRRERTPPPTAAGLQSQSFTHSTANEIMGEMTPDKDVPAQFPQSCVGCFPVPYTDEEQSSFIATTTGASFGKMTAATATTYSTRSYANGLFSRQRSLQRGEGLFDSNEELSSSAREVLALDVPSLAPTIRQPQPPNSSRPLHTFFGSPSSNELSSSAREMVALDVVSLAPTYQAASATHSHTLHVRLDTDNTQPKL